MIQRTVFLGETVEATAAFFEEGNPVTPINPSSSPVYIVRDTQDDIVTFGVAAIGTDNLYHTTFILPSTASLSTEDKKYVIEWDLQGSNGKNYKISEYFDVIHPLYNIIKEKEIQKITLATLPLVLTLPLPSTPDGVVSCKVYDQTSNIIFSIDLTNSGSYSDYLIYTATIPANTLIENNEYIVIFDFTLGGEKSNFHQKINCIDIWSLARISDMRMYLDKVQKDIDLYTGYRDSDLYYHIHEGLNFLNMLWPLSGWTLNNFKSTMAGSIYTLIGCACYTTLRAQYLAEGDSAFDYSGQPVSLTVDRSQYIESELGRWDSWINDILKPWKKDIVMKSNMAGNLNLTFPTVSGLNAQAMNLQYKGFPIRQFYQFRRY